MGYVDLDDIVEDVFGLGGLLLEWGTIEDSDPAHETHAHRVVSTITAMAKAYTRDRGFDGDKPNEEIAAVVKTASIRFMANPSQLSNATTVGPFSKDFREGFTGWTLAEQIVLNRYRVRAM